jgi:hypothetical protein
VLGRPRRTLTLAREVLTELAAADLTVVNGARQTQLSCDYYSCNPLLCTTRDTLVCV